MEVRETGLRIAGVGIVTIILGCLGVLAAVAACVGGTLYLATSSMKSSEVYTEALAAAQNDPQVQEALGTPIEAGTFVTGSMQTQGLSGDASLNIPISGPNGSGTIFASARRENGEWVFYTLAVAVDGSDDLIVLLEE
jgi:hypothetical protein